MLREIFQNEEIYVCAEMQLSKLEEREDPPQYEEEGISMKYTKSPSEDSPSARYMKDCCPSRHTASESNEFTTLR